MCVLQLINGVLGIPISNAIKKHIAPDSPTKRARNRKSKKVEESTSEMHKSLMLIINLRVRIVNANQWILLGISLTMVIFRNSKIKNFFFYYEMLIS